MFDNPFLVLFLAFLTIIVLSLTLSSIMMYKLYQKINELKGYIQAHLEWHKLND